MTGLGVGLGLGLGLELGLGLGLGLESAGGFVRVARMASGISITTATIAKGQSFLGFSGAMSDTACKGDVSTSGARASTGGARIAGLLSTSAMRSVRARITSPARSITHAVGADEDVLRRHVAM